MRWGAAILLGMVLLVAGLGKVRDPLTFADQVAAYQILPRTGLVGLSTMLIWLEIVVGVCLLIGVWRQTAFAAAAALFALFVVFVGVALLRGQEGACGCFGDLLPDRSVSLWLLVGDGLAIILACLGLALSRSRSGQRSGDRV